MHKPSWFKSGKTLVINAKTCGINKDGREQYLVNPETGVRSILDIDDDLAECCNLAKDEDGNFIRKEIFYRDTKTVKNSEVYVPKYFDNKTLIKVENILDKHEGLKLKTLAELKEEGKILMFGGHGSPSPDQRLGEIPYIKVSDLRAGHVNINPTNMIPIVLAKKYWRSNKSNLLAYDLLSPERASKNIGEFCVLMPGQESAVLTKEIIIIRTNTDLFDQFFLLWALTLKEVVDQWERIVFMQTNREDVGARTNEIIIPVPDSRETADELSTNFRNYYMSLERARRDFVDSINSSKFEHHIHLGI